MSGGKGEHGDSATRSSTPRISGSAFGDNVPAGNGAETRADDLSKHSSGFSIIGVISQIFKNFWFGKQASGETIEDSRPQQR